MRDLDLIPLKYKEKREQKKRKTETIIAIGLVLVILFSAGFSVYRYKLSLEEQKANWDRKLLKLGTTYELGKQYDSLKLQYNQRQKLSKGIKTIGIDLNKVLSQLEKNSPEGFSITSLSISKQGTEGFVISITGLAASSNEVATFVDLAEKDKLFSGITITSLNRKNVNSVKLKEYIFAMELKII